MRNVKPLWSNYGLLASLTLGGFDMWTNNLFGLSLFGTLKHGKTDAAATGQAKDFKPIDYPKPDGVLSFDRLTNVAFSFTNHEESQPAHLKLKDPSVPIRVNLPKYAEPAQRYCPAGVYEVVAEAGKDAALRHQLPELRPLQDLRHQGPQPEHRLDHAAGRRRARTIPTCDSCASRGAIRPLGRPRRMAMARPARLASPRNIRSAALVPDPPASRHLPCALRCSAPAGRRRRRRGCGRLSRGPLGRDRQRLCRGDRLVRPRADLRPGNPRLLEGALVGKIVAGRFRGGDADRAAAGPDWTAASVRPTSC